MCRPVLGCSSPISTSLLGGSDGSGGACEMVWLLHESQRAQHLSGPESMCFRHQQLRVMNTACAAMGVPYRPPGSASTAAMSRYKIRGSARLHLHVGAGRALDRLELAVAGLAGGHLAACVFAYPLLPDWPP